MIYSYSKKNQKSNCAVGSKAIDPVAVTHEGSFFYIEAYFSTQNITYRIYQIRSILKLSTQMCWKNPDILSHA